MVPVGIYDSLGKDGVRYILKNAGVELVLADDATRVRNLIEWKDEVSALKIIVTFVEPTPDLVKAAQEKNLQLLTYQQLREMGRENLIEFVPPKISDIALIIYTSGSTGEPKGTMKLKFLFIFKEIFFNLGCKITHENFITAMFGCAAAIDFDSLAKHEVPRALNFLPMAHMFGCGTVVSISYLGKIKILIL